MPFKNSSKEPEAMRLPGYVRSNTLVGFWRISPPQLFTAFAPPPNSIQFNSLCPSAGLSAGALRLQLVIYSPPFLGRRVVTGD
jgi:hypothetical protein